MSYILDALKKSEQQRDIRRIPTLTDAPPAGDAGLTRRNLPVIGAFLLAMLAVLLALYAVFNGHFLTSPDSLETPRITSTGIDAKPPETPERADAAGTPSPVNLPTIGESEADAEEKTQPLPATPPRSSTEKTAAAEPQPKTTPETVPPGEAIPSSPPTVITSTRAITSSVGARETGEENQSNREMLQEKPMTVPSNVRPSITAKRSEQPAPEESAAVKTFKPPGVPVLRPPPERTVSTDPVARRSTTPQAIPEGKDTEAEKSAKIIALGKQLPAKALPRARPGTEHVLPYDVYRRLPERKVSALAYSEVPARRFVIVNSRKMREKESTEQGLVVEEITDNGVIFSFQGHRFFRKLIP